MERLLELFSEDKELHDALVDLLKAQAEHERALAVKARRIEK